MAKVPKSKKPFKLVVKANVGRGRLPADALKDNIMESWSDLQNGINEMDNRAELYEYFRDCEETMGI